MCAEIYKNFGFAKSRSEPWDNLDLTSRQEAIEAVLNKYNNEPPFEDTDVDTRELIRWRLFVLHKYKKPKNKTSKPLAPSNVGSSQGIFEKMVRAYDADDCRYRCKCTY